MPLGQGANGISEDLVSATIIATTAPVLLAPAMHTEMWEHPATERNLETLPDSAITSLAPKSDLWPVETSGPAGSPSPRRSWPLPGTCLAGTAMTERSW